MSYYLETRDSDLFRDIVIHPDEHFSPDWADPYEFSFQTVSYRTPYSYCFCMCGYENEYFEYISDTTGEIDHTIFERTVQNIADGKCPHADKVPSKYLATSKVWVDNIVAAMPNELRKEPLECYNNMYGGIFRLKPFVIAVLKNNHRSGLYLCQANEPWWEEILYPTRTCDNQNQVTVCWERLSLLEYCAKKGNTLMFRHVLGSSDPFALECEEVCVVVYELAFKYDLKEIIHNLLVKGIFNTILFEGSHKLDTSMKANEWKPLERRICAEVAIVYNLPNILDYELPLLADKLTEHQKHRLIATCMVLKRHKCTEVLLKHGFMDNVKGSAEEKHKQLVELLFTYQSCGKEIAAVIKQTYYSSFFETGGQIDFGRENYFTYRLDFRIMGSHNIAIAQILIALRAEINRTKFYSIEEYDDPGLVLHTGKAQFDLEEYQGISREQLELWLYTNPSNLDRFADRTMKIYSNCETSDLFKKDKDLRQVNRTYYMDGNEHFLFSGENFALNFPLPLLTESGCKLKRNDMESILLNEKTRKMLHPCEIDYLKVYLERPRSLQLCCRDTLRTYFKRKQIHKYLSVSKAPNKIKDFILLKTVLPTLKYIDNESLLL